MAVSALRIYKHGPTAQASQHRKLPHSQWETLLARTLLCTPTAYAHALLVRAGWMKLSLADCHKLSRSTRHLRAHSTSASDQYLTPLLPYQTFSRRKLGETQKIRTQAHCLRHRRIQRNGSPVSTPWSTSKVALFWICLVAMISRSSGFRLMEGRISRYVLSYTNVNFRLTEVVAVYAIWRRLYHPQRVFRKVLDCCRRH